ncbi:hypothetical protein BHM03_00033404 [Ensete ventricosum]|nr:hypothetical protein BHM03_00033404 [Ensete ventricosum]
MESNSIDGHLENNGNHAHFDGPLKVIIDTDPGIANDLQRWHGDDRCNCEVNFVLIFPGGKPRVADFIHGSDGLGNIFLPPPLGKKIEKTASEFLVEKVSQYPGDVCILALGPLTNLALIYGDPEAADVVFTCGADVVVVGINVTTQVKLTALVQLSNAGIFPHDPVSFAALVHPDLFTFRKGVVRVETRGICIGHTLMDQGLKE